MSYRLNDPRFLVEQWDLNGNSIGLIRRNDGVWGAGDEGYADGPFGKQVADFDGAANLSVGADINSLLAGATGIAMSLWFDADVAASPDTFFGFEIDGASTGFQIRWINPTDLIVGGRSQAADGFFTDTYTLPNPTNEITHCVGVLDFVNDAIEIYIDGDLVSTNAAAFGSSIYVPGVPTNTAQFGASPSGTANFYDGTSWTSRLYNIAPTGDEVKDLFLFRR